MDGGELDAGVLDGGALVAGADELGVVAGVLDDGELGARADGDVVGVVAGSVIGDGAAVVTESADGTVEASGATPGIVVAVVTGVATVADGWLLVGFDGTVEGDAPSGSDTAGSD